MADSRDRRCVFLSQTVTGTNSPDKKLNLRGLEVTFEEDIAKARADLESVPIQRGKRTLERARFAPVEELARTHPPAAIIEAWKLLEEELVQFAVKSGNPKMANTPFRVFPKLRKEGRVGSNAARVFDTLRSLRNEAVHKSGFTVTEGQALEYVDLAESMVAFIRGMPIKKSNEAQNPP